VDWVACSAMSYDPATYWSEVARHVDARAPGDDWDLAGDGGPFLRHKRAMVLQRLATLDVVGKSVLELGPGPGGNLRALREHGAKRLIGCDIAPEMVRLAQRNLGDSAEICLLDGPTLPFSDQEVDVVLTVTVLHHNPEENLLALLDELTRVAGTTIEMIEDTTTFRPRSFGGSYFVRDVNTYIAWVTARGFRLVEVQPMNAWASERAWLGIRRLGRLLTRRSYKEGQAVSATEAAFGRALLAVTQRVDPQLPPLSGMTAMRFERSS
jgi:SAM-dependent methyltransferase